MSTGPKSHSKIFKAQRLNRSTATPGATDDRRQKQMITAETISREVGGCTTNGT
jgi:hypothetical protein